LNAKLEAWKVGKLEKDPSQKIVGFCLYPLFHYSSTPLFQTKKGGGRRSEEAKEDALLAGIRPLNTKHLTLNTIQTQEVKQ